MIILEQKDFELSQSFQSHKGYFYYYAAEEDRRIRGLVRNWPFHNSKEERDKFLDELGMEYLHRDCGFPYTRTSEEATIILVVAINEYNERENKIKSK